MRRKKQKLLKVISSRENVRVMISFFVLIVLVVIILFQHRKLALAEFIEISTFSAIILAFLLDSLTKILVRNARKKIEDRNKLTEDYDRLIKNYCRVKFMEVNNSHADENNKEIAKKNTLCTEKKGVPNTYILPICDKICLYGKSVEFCDNPDKMYEPNTYIWERMERLGSIHEFSNIYNNMNIRVDKVKEEENKIKIYTSRTKYYYSLMTNRAIDYKIDNLSYRELFEEGPFLRDLEHSTLSNHLGFNGYVETIDDKFIFILRHQKVSIGKNTLQNSIGASLKTKIALTNNGVLPSDGSTIIDAIKEEIYDELKLKNLSNDDCKKKIIQNVFGHFSLKNNVIFFYRDLVEGGKPQLFFHTKIQLTSKDLVEAYTKGAKINKNDREGYTAADGYKMLLVDKKDLEKIYLTPDGVTINGKWYRAMPSVVASQAMLMEYLHDYC